LTGGLEGVTRVLGHPQALAQCQAWLSRNHPGLERLPVASNAQAARMASEDPTCAAIAGDAAAAAWGLSAVASGIQDDPQNQTRFVAVGLRDAGPTGRDKTSLVLALPNRAGAVYDMLAPLSRHGVSMTRLEDRKSTRLNSSHVKISYAVFCVKKKNTLDRVADADLGIEPLIAHT